ncbi:hypothetical protein GC163_06350 [bacterium]|nr:hypothetical protein [bacterium]
MADSSTRILKAHAVRELPARTAFNFEDLQTQAAQHVNEARAEAAKILEQARQEAEAQRKKVLDEARAQGKQEGLKDSQKLIDQQVQQLTEQRFQEHLKSTLPAIAQVAEALKLERDHWRFRWEQAAVELGVAIAEKLLRTTLQAQPERATEMISAALELAAGQPQLLVRLHPADLERLGSHAEELVKTLTACGQPQIVGDAQLSPGECRLDTGHGEIDARLSVMLGRITDELLAT